MIKVLNLFQNYGEFNGDALDFPTVQNMWQFEIGIIKQMMMNNPEREHVQLLEAKK